MFFFFTPLGIAHCCYCQTGMRSHAHFNTVAPELRDRVDVLSSLCTEPGIRSKVSSYRALTRSHSRLRTCWLNRRCSPIARFPLNGRVIEFCLHNATHGVVCRLILLPPVVSGSLIEKYPTEKCPTESGYSHAETTAPGVTDLMKHTLLFGRLNLTNNVYLTWKS